MTFVGGVIVLLAGLALPARAEPWLAGDMVDAGAHPRTLGGEGDRARLQDRVDREPYRGLLQRIAGQAALDVPLDDHTKGVEATRGATARAAAWLFWLDRTVDADGNAVPFASEGDRDAMGQKAATLLLSMYTVSRAKDSDAVLDIYTAEELHYWADTLDLLLGADRDALGSNRAAAVQGVADLAADFYADFMIDNWLFARSLLNNHLAKTAAALGLAAIAVNGEDYAATVPDGRYDASSWVDFAMRYTDMAPRDILTDEDGGNAEGGSYLAYSGQDHVLFAWAWHRYTGGADWATAWDPEAPPYHVVGLDGPYVVTDPWDANWLDRQALWAVRTMLPDGSVAPVDDSTPGARFWYGGLVDATWPHAGLFRWAWERNGYPAGGQVEPFLVAAYDDDVAAVSPEESGLAPTQVLPYAGAVAFRSGWGVDDTLALLVCEHGKAAAWSQTRWGQYIDSNGGHEHPDGTSFSVYAGGETLALDSGYLGWPNHAKVNEAWNHSLVLVDGRGPSGSAMAVPPFDLVDGELVLTDPTVEGGWMPSDDGKTYLVAEDDVDADLGFADVVTAWFGDAPYTDVQRRATFLDGRYLVLHDRLVTPDGATHRYTHQLHTHCGGTGGGAFEPSADGAWCTRTGARLDAIVLSPSPVERGSREAIHDDGGWAERTHEVIETSVSTAGGEPAEFLSVLLPEPATADGWDEAPASACGDLCRAWTHAGRTCEAWIGGARDVLSPAGTRLVTADSGAWCGDSESLSGSFVGLDGDASAEVTARFAFGSDGSVEGWRARVHAFAASAVRATITLPAVNGAEPAGACGWVDDAGRWRIDAIGDVHTAANAPAVVARVGISGRSPHEPRVAPVSVPVTLDATISCAPASATYTWTLVQRPEVSTVALPAGNGPTLTFVPDLPGLWRVRVQVDDAAGSDVAELAFEVEGEPIAAVPADTDSDSDTDTDTDGRRCGCGHGGGGFGLALALAALSMRRQLRARSSR